jgi:23S rRNA maturation-related 3'-5' exoribonuclease YhaM
MFLLFDNIRIFEYQITRAMTTKLTLTMEDKVIDSAKKYARQQGKSLSGIVENYLKSISTQETTAENLSPKVARLKGVIKLPDDFDYKKEIGNALARKYR